MDNLEETSGLAPLSMIGAKTRRCLTGDVLSVQGPLLAMLEENIALYPDGGDGLEIETKKLTDASLMARSRKAALWHRGDHLIERGRHRRILAWNVTPARVLLAIYEAMGRSDDPSARALDCAGVTFEPGFRFMRHAANLCRGRFTASPLPQGVFFCVVAIMAMGAHFLLLMKLGLRIRRINKAVGKFAGNVRGARCLRRLVTIHQPRKIC